MNKQRPLEITEKCFEQYFSLTKINKKQTEKESRKRISSLISSPNQSMSHSLKENGGKDE